MSQFLQTTDPTVLALAMISIQILVVVGIAKLIQRCLLCHSAAWQHFVWVAVVCSIALAIPLQALLPSQTIGLPGGDTGTVPFSNNVAKGELQPVVRPEVIVDEGVYLRESPRMGASFTSEIIEDGLSQFEISDWPDGESTVQLPAQAASAESNLSSIGAAPEPLVVAATVDEGTLPTIGALKYNWITLAVGCYGLVVFVLLVRLSAAWLSLRWTAVEPLKSNRALHIAKAVAKEVGLTAMPMIGTNGRIRTPMAFGVLRPTVVLPDDFLAWSTERQRIVLLHEFNHVKRHDGAWDLLSHFVSLVYWFHPAVRYAGQQLRASREMATDAAVVNHGVDPARYANELLEIAMTSSGEPGQSLTMGMPMAGGQELTNRIKRVLNAGPERSPHGFIARWGFRSAIAMVFLGIVGTSVQFSFAKNEAVVPMDQSKVEPAMRPVRSMGVVGGIVDNAMPTIETESIPREMVKEPAQEATSDDQSRFVARPQDSESAWKESASIYERLANVEPRSLVGKAVGGVKEVTVSGVVRDQKGNPVSGALVALRDRRALSSRGKPEINDIYGKVVSNAAGEFRFEQVPVERSFDRLQVLAAIEGGEIGWKSISLRQNTKVGGLRIDLIPSVPMTGRVVDENGKPVSGVRMHLSSLSQETGASRRKYLGLTDRLISPTTYSDADGRYVFPFVPEGFAASVTHIHAEYANYGSFIRCAKDKENRFFDKWLRDRSIVSVENGGDIVLKQGVLIGGRVLDANSNPIQNVSVSIGDIGQSTTTNDRGEFRLRSIADKFDFEKRVALGLKFSKPKEDVQVDSGEYRVAYVDWREIVDQTAKIQFVKPAVFTGRVLEAKTREPIPGVSVATAVPTKTGVGMTEAASQTDQNGEYRIVARNPGTVTVVLQGVIPGYSGFAEGFSDEGMRNIEVKPGTTTELGTILMKPIAPVAVKVVDSHHRPLEGINVESVKYSGGNWPSYYPNVAASKDANARALLTARYLLANRHATLSQAAATTGADGKTILSPAFELPQGGLLIAKGVVDGKLWMGEAIANTRGQPTTVVVQPATRLGGKVTCEGRPLEGVVLKVESSYRTIETTTGNGGLNLWHAVGTVATDADGAYTLPVSKANFAGEIATYRVRVESGVPNTQATTVSRGATFDGAEFRHDIKFQLGKGVIAGNVVGMNGEPLSDVKVMVRRSGPRGARVAPERLFENAHVQTDADGKFVLRGLPEGIELRIETFRPGQMKRDNANAKYYDSKQTVRVGTIDLKIKLEVDLQD